MSEVTVADPAVSNPVPVATAPWENQSVDSSSSGSSPWGKKENVIPCSLQEVMSEQLATQLQEDDFGEIRSPNVEDFGAIIDAAQCDDTSNDELLAQYLQMQYDTEHDDMLNVEEQKYNGKNKISISFEKYKTLHPAYRDEDDKLDDANIVEQKTEWGNPAQQIGRSGIAGKGKNITTKHDLVICGRKNAEKLMQFPPDFEAGDGEIMDMQLPNHVYNKLKLHSLSENKRHHRLHDKKDLSTSEKAMDPRTRLLLYKLVNAGVLESVNGAISSGKESVVFHADGGSLKNEKLPDELCIKVFKTTLNEFKTREKYVHGDHRFFQDDYKKKNPRKIIKIWAEKETANLNRMNKFNLPCPEVIVLRKHVLVMSFIGEDQKPAPKLKEAVLSDAEVQIAYEQVISIMKRLHEECHLVHADLSEYNLLWHKNQVWVIDVSQGVDLTHPRAMEFLYRDCTNISQFFTKKKGHDVSSPEALFNELTEMNIKGTGKEFVAQVQRCDKQKDEEMLAHQMSDKPYAFDYYFNKAQKEREAELAELGISGSEDEEEKDSS